MVAGVLSNVVVDRSGSLVNWIWWAWLVLLAWFVWKVATWSVDYFVITNQRMLLTTGLITRKVAMMPLAKVTDMSFRRSIRAGCSATASSSSSRPVKIRPSAWSIILPVP